MLITKKIVAPPGKKLRLFQTIKIFNTESRGWIGVVYPADCLAEDIIV